jgi:CubicO group peptidase (beta-lactamase class C family)
MSRLLPAIVLLGFMILPGSPALSQSIYFPPDNNADWERVAPESLGWDTARLDELLQWLGESETMAFVILKDGKLVVEQYYGLFNRDREWYWASAGKTVTAVLIGALQQQGLMDIHQPTSRYLGAGWTSLTPEQEQRITPWHQLTMTTGVDYGVADKDCTLPQCLRYRANAGEQWFYHNAPYTLLTHVAEAAADTNINTLLNKAFESVPGIKLRYINGLGSPYNRVVASRALDMARFGLLVSNRMAWGEGAPLVDSTFADAMLKPSQRPESGLRIFMVAKWAGFVYSAWFQHIGTATTHSGGTPRHGLGTGCEFTNFEYCSFVGPGYCAHGTGSGNPV